MSLQPNPTQVLIDLSAIRYNYREVRKRIPEGQKILCVVKSNAYGHGLERVGHTLEEEGADFFGVRATEEGVVLRKAGVKVPILLMLGIIDESFDELVQFNLTPVITRLDIAQAFDGYLKGIDKKHPAHVKIDTGMSRLGIPMKGVIPFFEELKKLNQLEVTGVLSHLAEATDPEYTAFQKENFDDAHQTLEKSGWKITTWHLGNSTAAIRSLFPEYDMVRLGIVLYGSAPDPALEGEIALKPALTWTTQVLELKEIPKGRAVSYGCTFVAKRPTRIGILPVGYADGYPRLLSNRAKVLICGSEAPIIGRVCMDLTVIDLTDIPEAGAGDRVTLLGRNGERQILAEDLAKWGETISYEIFTNIAARVPRNYQD